MHHGVPAIVSQVMLLMQKKNPVYVLAFLGLMFAFQAS